MSQYTVKLDRDTLEQLRIALQVALPILDDAGPEVPLAFDEAYYLDANPDVRAAVEDRIFRSGYEHYIRHGKAEGRRPTRPMDPAPRPTPEPAPHWAPAESYPSRQDLVDALTSNRFTHGVQVDGADVFDGFGPAMQFWTWPDNTVRSRKPSVPELRSSYGSVEQLLAHANAIEWQWAIVIDGQPVKQGFEADGNASQYETVNGVIVRAR